MNPSEYLLEQYDELAVGVPVDNEGNMCYPGNPAYRELFEVLPDDPIGEFDPEHGNKCYVCAPETSGLSDAQKRLLCVEFHLTPEEIGADCARTHP